MSGAALAITTSKGALQLYDSHERRKLALPGKHSKRGMCVVWTSTGKVVTAGLDRAVSAGRGLRSMKRAYSSTSTSLCSSSERHALEQACVGSMGSSRWGMRWQVGAGCRRRD
jgi:hypothetical protein